MKTLIAATLFAIASGSAFAGTPEAFGGPELNSDLISERSQASGSGDPVFEHERNVGSVELYPTLYRELGDGPDVPHSHDGDEVVEHNTFSDIYTTG